MQHNLNAQIILKLEIIWVNNFHINSAYKIYVAMKNKLNTEIIEGYLAPPLGAPSIIYAEMKHVIYDEICSYSA